MNAQLTVRAPLLDALDSINPAALTRDEWLSCGMALHHEKCLCGDWDSWSARDAARYHPGECERKWAGFNGGNGQPVTAGTIVMLAKRFGWVPPRGPENVPLDWDDVIQSPRDDYQIIDPGWIQDAEIATPNGDWNPVRELSTYLSILFESSEYVGYVVESWTNEDGRNLPKKGSYTRTAGELLHELGTCNGDIGKVIGDYNTEVGAWIRFNPLDGQGVRDENVTSYRYALIESDTLPIEKQAAIYAELELPVAVLVHSGKKSLHAIVNINAASKEEYRERVRFLHAYCEKHGLEIDKANRNPSRLSRLPGVVRNGAKQYIVATHQGKASWDEWKAFVDGQATPEYQAADISLWLTAEPPAQRWLFRGLVPANTISGVTAAGGASKSQASLQLAFSLLTGKILLPPFEPVARGRVLLLNAEDDASEIWRRAVRIFRAFDLSQEDKKAIVRGLRVFAGQKIKIATKAANGDIEPNQNFRWLEKQIREFRPSLLILDPQVSVFGGDENSNDDCDANMGLLRRLLDTAGGAMTIWTSHHVSKSREELTTASAGRGASSVRDAMRSLFQLLPLSDAEVAQFGVSNRSLFVRLEHVKANYSQRLDIPVYYKRSTGDNGGVLSIVDMASQRLEVESAMLSNVAKSIAEMIGFNSELSAFEIYEGKPCTELRHELKSRHGATVTGKFIARSIEYGIREGILESTKMSAGKGPHKTIVKAISGLAEASFFDTPENS